MGTLPNLSILKGPRETLRKRNEPLQLHRIFEFTVSCINSLNNNNEKVDFIHGILLRKCEPQIIFQNRKIDLHEINDRSNQLARAILGRFSAKGNRDGDRIIAVDMQPSDKLISSLLAIWKTGSAYLPLDAAFPNDRVHHILNESQPCLVITENQERARYGDHSTVTYETLENTSRNLSSHNLNDESTWNHNGNEKDLIAIILYTSGSSGVPKGVRIPHAVILNRLKWQWKTFPYLPEETTCLFKTALTFVDSVAELWGPLLYGKSLLVLQKSDVLKIDRFIELLDNYRIHRLVLVPTLLQSLLLYMGMVSNAKTPFRPEETVDHGEKLGTLRYVVCSGETLSGDLASKFYQYFPKERHTLLNFYGSTEVMGDVLYYRVGHSVDSEKVPIGMPVDNTNIYILDKNFRPVNAGEIGELYVSGLNLALGYVNGRDPEKFLDNPLTIDPAHIKLYRTGDFARLEKDLVIYEGRIDSQIKIRGHKVDIAEIELALGKISDIDKFVVLCYNAGRIDQALLAFVVPKKENLTSQQTEETLSRSLPPYMIPQVISVKLIPLLVNGKVDRQYLLKKYESDYKGNKTSVEFDYTGVPTSYLSRAKALFETVALTLGPSLREKINPSANYYNLGGNSLTSVLTVTKLRDLGYIISIGEFIMSHSMLDIIMRMKEEENLKNVNFELLSQIPKNKYKLEMLDHRHKEDTINIITSSFYEKADLERYILHLIKKTDYRELIEALWQPLVDAQLSFALKNEDGEVIAVCMNFDGHAEPEVAISSKLTIVFEFLEFLEAPFRDNELPMGTGQILHSFMMGTAASVPAHQNVELMLYLEWENLNLARKKGFAGIFTTNTSPLTQQLGTDVFEYQVLLDYQINKYIAPDKTRPFAKAADSERAVVSWKRL